MSAVTLNKRVLISLTTMGAFFVMATSGLVLYFVPQGRIAYWVNWTLLGLTKTGWENIHTISSVVFVISGIFHLYFNWRAIVSYLSARVGGTLRYRLELILSVAIVSVCLIGAVLLFPPFNYIIDLSDHLKQAWVRSPEYNPPFGHAEDVSLKVFAKKTDIDLHRAVKELRDRGISFNSVEDKLKDIAVRNGIRPMDIYIAIKNTSNIQSSLFKRQAH